MATGWRELSLQESCDHFRRGDVVPLVADRAGPIHLRARIGDVGPGRTDVFVVGVGNPCTMALRARDPLELMAPGQWLLHECQVTYQASGVGAQDVLGIRVAGRLTVTGGGCGTGRPRAFHARSPDSSHAEACGQSREHQRGQDAQTVSQARSHWYPGVRWAR
jgi:hypothetical protein